LYDVINNAIVFAEPISILLYSSFEIRVGDNEDELGDSLSDIAILASIADDIVNTSSISADVSIVSDISDKVVIVANNDTSVTTVANNMAGVQDVHNNLAEILEADANANIATTKAAEALASANASQASRLVSDANKIATNADVLATNADVITTNSNAATTTANAAAAATSETNAELSEWEAEASRLTVVSYATEAEDVVVNIVTSDGDGTYTYTPQTGVYSALHHELKAATFNPVLYATTAFVASALGSVEGVPAGVITMWSGLISAIPSGWFLCNGANSTHDLRGRFIYGASVDGDVGVTGGSANAIVVSHTHSTPAHTHTASSNTTGAHTHSFYNNSLTVGGGGFYINKHATYHAGVTAITGSSGNHSHTITVNSGGGGTSGSTGSSGTNANLPPYMKLAYIMKG
jgi:hypothetical protein